MQNPLPDTNPFLRDLLLQMSQGIVRVENKLDQKVDRHELKSLEQSIERMNQRLENMHKEHDDRLDAVEKRDIAAEAVSSRKDFVFNRAMPLLTLLVAAISVIIAFIALKHGFHK